MSFNEWRTVKLKDISVGNKGSYGIGASAVEYDEDLYTYLRITDITDDGRLNKEGLKSVDDEDAKNYILKENDIVFARTGNSTGRSYFYEPSDGELVYAGFLIKFSLDKSKVNPRFIKLYTLTKAYKDWINSISTGSTRKNINAKMYGEMDIKLPSRAEQDFIVDLIEPLNLKIEVNNKINQKLEEMAQAIFKQWFIDFDFPNEQGKPYKSSGGEMVESELGMIPKGWEVKSIGKLPVIVTDYVANGSFKSLKDNVTLYEEENYALFMRNTDLKCKFSSDKKFVDEHSYKFLDKSKLFGGEVIISNVGDVGSVYMCPLFDRPMTLGNNVIMINTEKNNTDLNKYLFRLFKSYLGQHLIRSITGGSAQPKFNKTDFRNIKIAIPKNNILNIYNEVLKQVENKILKIDIENSKISTIRDTILPKLMSGEIRVSIEK